jgi:ArsR family transcriptional regulator, arsenate/arsenite/antimonite-responsive transcriptional repressor
MESKSVIVALEALAQEHRLAVFRALVQAGRDGLTPTYLSDSLDLPAPTLSFHLAQLKHAGLIAATRDGRSLIYTAEYEAIRGVIDFLSENCCAGASCAVNKPKERSRATATRARRRA